MVRVQRQIVIYAQSPNGIFALGWRSDLPELARKTSGQYKRPLGLFLDNRLMWIKLTNCFQCTVSDTGHSLLIEYVDRGKHRIGLYSPEGRKLVSSNQEGAPKRYGISADGSVAWSEDSDLIILGASPPKKLFKRTWYYGNVIAAYFLDETLHVDTEHGSRYRVNARGRLERVRE